MDIKDSYLHGTVGVVKSINVNADKLSYTLADVDGTIKEVTLPVATLTANGLLSSTDKKKLDSFNLGSLGTDLTLKINSGTTEGTNQYTYNGSVAKTLDIKLGSNITLIAEANSLTINASDTKVTLTNTTDNASYRVLFSRNANDTSETATVRKSANLTFSPYSGVLTVNTVATSGLKSPYSNDNIYDMINPHQNALTYSRYSYPVFKNESGITVNGNANGVLWVGTHGPENPNTSTIGYGHMLGFIGGDGALYHKVVVNGNTTKAWKQIAYTSSNITGNAASTDKLKTKRKLWGLDFDGSADVNGDMAGVGNINIDSTNNQDRFITFDTNKIPFSWRLGYLGSGSDNANYFVIQSGGKSGSTLFTNALQLGCYDLKATFGGTVVAPTFQGNLDGAYINKLTDYTKADTVEALTIDDTLNTALGKLEYKADTAYNLVKGAYDGDGTIENLAEILKVLEGIKDTETIQAIIGKYLPLTGGTMMGKLQLTQGSSSIRDNTDRVLLSYSNSSSFSGVTDGTDTVVVGNDAYNTVIRSNNTDIMHYKESANYAILDASNYARYMPILNSASTHATNTSVIYAPTTSGYKGSFVLSSGSGAPTWSTLKCLTFHPSDNGGRDSYLLIADLTLPEGQTSLDVSLIGTMYGHRGGNMSLTAVYNIIAQYVIWSDGSEHYLLYVNPYSTSNLIPYIVQYNNKKYLALKKRSSTSYVYFVGLALGMLDDAIALDSPNNESLPEGMTIYKEPSYNKFSISTNKYYDGTKNNTLLHSGNYTLWINTTNFPGLNKTGTVTSIKVGSTSYSPSSGVVSLPAYPTSLKNPNAIKFKNAAGTEVSYDGSAAVDLTSGVNYATDATNLLIYKSLSSSAYTTVKAMKDQLKVEFGNIKEGVGSAINIPHQTISNWSDESFTYNSGGIYTAIKLSGGYSGNTYGLWLLSAFGDERLHYVGLYNGEWTPLRKIAITTDIPTKTSQLTNDSGYLTSRGYIGTTAVQASSANLHLTGIDDLTMSGTLKVNRITSNNDSLQLKYQEDNTKSVILNGTAFKPFDDATGKLALGSTSARWSTIYGVSGSFTKSITSSLTTASHLAGNLGVAIINSTASGSNNYTMLAKMNSTNGVFCQGVYRDSYDFYYTVKTTIDEKTNSVTKRLTLLDESGNSYFPGDITALGFKKSKSSDSYVLLGGGGHKSLSSLTASKLNSTTIIDAKTLNLSNVSWIDTGYTFANLDSGTYAVQVTSGSNLVASGIMSVYKNLEDTIGDEIPLHVYHKPSSGNAWRPYLRTYANKLLISSNDTTVTSRTVTIKIALIL